MTKQKRLIMEIIRECHENRVHPTAEDIFFEARKKLPNIALGTVYRNLNILSEEGVIRRLSVAGNPDRFDLNAMTHDHLVCSRCGRLKDVEIKGVSEAIKELTGEDILSYELNAYYVCNDCKNEEVKK